MNTPVRPDRSWFRSARFGVSFRWGVASVPERGDGWLRSAEKIPLDAYVAFFSGFRSGHDWAATWAAAVKASGAGTPCSPPNTTTGSASGPPPSPITTSASPPPYRGKLSLQCRAELITDGFLAAASRLNVTLEFGLQTIHDSESDAVKRHNKIDKVDEALRKVRALGIHHEVSLIFGLPTQTLASFRKTVDWCLARRVPVIKAFPLMLLRGTQLAVDASRWSLRESGHAMPFVISSSTFTEQDWAKMNAISDALKATEGRHPTSIDQLPLAADTRDSARWTPELVAR